MLTRSTYVNEPLFIEKDLKNLFRKKTPSVIFEIGACEGEDTVRYSRLFPGSKIYAFEPLPKNVELLYNTLSKYSLTNVTVCNKALSSEIGTAEFYVSNGKPEGIPDTDWDHGNKSSSLLAPDRHIEMASYITFDQKIKVETTTLDHFCKINKIYDIDFIHMDVQGAELMVLQGAESMISSIKVIWLEVSRIHAYKEQPLVDDIGIFMEKNGLVLFKDCLEGVQGDQMYVSKKVFPDYKKIQRRINRTENLPKKVLRKIGNFFSKE